MEAGLLIVAAARRAAGAIARAVTARQPADVIVLAGSTPPDLAGLERFRLAIDGQTAALRQALAAAPLPAARPPAPAGQDRGIQERGIQDRGIQDRGLQDRGVGAILGQINPAIDAAAATVTAVIGLAQSFVTTASVSGLAASADDALLQRELAAALLATAPSPPRVRLAPLHDSAARAAVVAQLQAVADLAAQAMSRADGLDRGDANGVPAVTALRSAAKAASDLVTALSSADDTGTAPLDAITAQQALSDALGCGAVLVQASVAQSGASRFVRQNWWSGLFRAPDFEISAAVVAGYAAYAGATLDLVAAGHVRAPTPYVSARQLAATCDDSQAGRPAAP